MQDGGVDSHPESGNPLWAGRNENPQPGPARAADTSGRPAPGCGCREGWGSVPGAQWGLAESLLSPRCQAPAISWGGGAWGCGRGRGCGLSLRVPGKLWQEGAATIRWQGSWAGARRGPRGRPRRQPQGPWGQVGGLVASGAGLVAAPALTLARLSQQPAARPTLSPTSTSPRLLGAGSSQEEGGSSRHSSKGSVGA